jgi:hypothetical protein
LNVLKYLGICVSEYSCLFIPLFAGIVRLFILIRDLPASSVA